MELEGGPEAVYHDPIYIAYDRDGKHFMCLEKINIVWKNVELFMSFCWDWHSIVFRHWSDDNDKILV